jgi:transcriptional regulator with XRE-family HTH domain
MQILGASFHRDFRGRKAVLIIDHVSLGENVRAVRRRKFMTQEQLAKAAGISHRTLVNIERRKVTEPHFSTILKLANALEVEPSKLVDQDQQW